MKALCDRGECIRAAVQCTTALLATLKRPKTDAVLQLLEVHNVKTTDEVCDKLPAQDPNNKSMLEKLVLDGKCGASLAFETRHTATEGAMTTRESWHEGQGDPRQY